MAPERQREIEREDAMVRSLEAYALAIRKLSNEELAREYRPRELADDIRGLLNAETARRKFSTRHAVGLEDVVAHQVAKDLVR